MAEENKKDIVDGGQQDKPVPQPDEAKTFTQDELDAAIEKRLARERKKAEKDKADNDNDKDKTTEQKAQAKAEKEKKEQSEKVSSLEAKLLCFEKDVAKDNVSDVIALAKAYQNEDTSFEEAIDKVLKKYPSFVKGTKTADEDEDEDEKPITTGKKQKSGKTDISGVEAAFYKKNPDLKRN